MSDFATDFKAARQSKLNKSNSKRKPYKKASESNEDDPCSPVDPVPADYKSSCDGATLPTEIVRHIFRQRLMTAFEESLESGEFDQFFDAVEQLRLQSPVIDPRNDILNVIEEELLPSCEEECKQTEKRREKVDRCASALMSLIYRTRLAGDSPMLGPEGALILAHTCSDDDYYCKANLAWAFWVKLLSLHYKLSEDSKRPFDPAYDHMRVWQYKAFCMLSSQETYRNHRAGNMLYTKMDFIEHDNLLEDLRQRSKGTMETTPEWGRRPVQHTNYLMECHEADPLFEWLTPLMELYDSGKLTPEQLAILENPYEEYYDATMDTHRFIDWNGRSEPLAIFDNDPNVQKVVKFYRDRRYNKDPKAETTTYKMDKIFPEKKQAGARKCLERLAKDVKDFAGMENLYPDSRTIRDALGEEFFEGSPWNPEGRGESTLTEGDRAAMDVDAVMEEFRQTRDNCAEKNREEDKQKVSIYYRG